MKRYSKLICFTSLSLLLFSCGPNKKDANASINDKKVALEKLKLEKNNKEEEIRKLEEELAKIDTAGDNDAKIKLVAVAPVSQQDFKHYIDIRGKIDAENISYITPRGMGGQVKAIYVKEGQQVSKGQLLLKLDDAIQNQSVIAARQQLEGIKTQLSYARNIYERQKSLWDKGIGTEVQLISAQTNVKSLEDQLKAVSEQVKVGVEQQNLTNVYS
ncbi:MAG: biotin/lipoyl-binding protein, partial [Ferruginibacter sp.]|nr:biotin/lipoyl-binding protein [Ferruginibacter sp.]